jgi:hypothetical protein
MFPRQPPSRCYQATAVGQVSQGREAESAHCTVKSLSPLWLALCSCAYTWSSANFLVGQSTCDTMHLPHYKDSMLLPTREPIRIRHMYQNTRFLLYFPSSSLAHKRHLLIPVKCNIDFSTQNKSSNQNVETL